MHNGHESKTRAHYAFPYSNRLVSLLFCRHSKAMVENTVDCFECGHYLPALLST